MNVSNPLRHSQHRLKPTSSTSNSSSNGLLISPNASSSNHATAASFDQFIRNLSLEKQKQRHHQNNIQITTQQQPDIIQSDVYNIPWDFKNKIPIQNTTPPQPTTTTTTTTDEHYCAPWDLKLQEEKLKKNLSTANNSTNLNNNNLNNIQVMNNEANDEYNAPWEDNPGHILIKQIKLNKSSTSIASSASASSRTCSPTPTTQNNNQPVSSTLIKTTPPQAQYLKPTAVKQTLLAEQANLNCACEIASANHLLQPLCANHHHMKPHLVIADKFCSWGSNCSSNGSSSFDCSLSNNANNEDTRPLIRPRKASSQRFASNTFASEGNRHREELKVPTPPPLPAQPAYMAALQRQMWFHGKITRKVAENLLGGRPIGSYLVRQSESGDTNDFSLSLVSGSGCVHMRICMKNNEFILGQCSQPFVSIVKMIEHYGTVEVPIKGAQHVKLTHAVYRE